MAEQMKDLTIEVDDRPGVAAQIGESLGRAGVNIEAIVGVVPGSGKAVGRVLVSDSTKARRAIEEAGVRVVGEHDVLVVQIPDRPGELGKIARKVADAGVNLNGLYLATNTRLVLSPDNIEKARQAIGQETAA